jgi:uncharacterized damage-inducible protein DinB
MEGLLQQYSAYNVWANDTLLQRIHALNGEQVHATLPSSFPSVYKTLLHMWQAENVWWQRLNRVDTILYLGENFTGSIEELIEGFSAQDRQWKQWIDSATQEQLNDSFSFVRSELQHTMIVHEMLLHVFNHATFHRGQLVTMLRQLGETTIPSTDFSSFARLKDWV